MSLVYKATPPTHTGWYWAKTANGHEYVFHFSGAAGHRTAGVANPIAWAGPIPRPKEPTTEQLATVRYRLWGHWKDGKGGWGGGDWQYVDRAEIVREATLCLTGSTEERYRHNSIVNETGQVFIEASARRSGRWKRVSYKEFTLTKSLQGATDASRVHTPASAGAIPAPAPLSPEPRSYDAGGATAQHGGAFSRAPVSAAGEVAS